MRLPTRKSERERAQITRDPHITQQMYDRTVRELERLQKERLVLADEVARTGAMGDLSENAAYQYAKQHLRSVLSRITSLQHMLAAAVIIPHEVSNDGVIRLGSVVRIRLDDREMTWRLLGEREARPQHGVISVHSPVGNALLGHKVGDSVTLVREGKVIAYTILSVA